MVSHFSLMDVQGELTDPSTYVGIGTLQFTNKEKKEGSWWDFSWDALKEIGLDQEILKPTIGEIPCKLRGERLYFTDLKHSSSEGGHSFFHLSDNHPSYLSLTGDLHLNLKIEQNTLIKLIEPFTLQIRGTLEEPKAQLVFR